MQESNIALISLHPEHANKILSGEKKLEFRRVWASKPVSAVVIYATVPVQRIVAIAYVKKVHKGSANSLWKLAKEVGGGLSRRKLYNYFKGRKIGYAIEFASVKRCNTSIDPFKRIDNFQPPQSFTYLDPKIFSLLEELSMNTKPTGKILFIAGVHAVGKSTLCSTYARTHGVLHKSASQLIREAKENAIAKNTKAVRDIPGNQQLLIQAVSEIRAAGKTLLLDGHFALLNSENKPQPLPMDVYIDLTIDGIVVLHDKPAAIAARMLERDGNSLQIDEITALQHMELKRAKQVAGVLNLPLERIRSFDQEKFDGMANSILKEPPS